ncbi:MAG: carbohydrate-binding protein, partial [Fibrobacter sp.]|nr:carbohydrate-binding protein [Fibrobacter sp.]
NTYAENKCEVSGLKGIVNQLFLVFKGNQDSTMYVKAWGFEGSGTTPPEPQKPFGGKAWAIPGKIEMENFDEPGTGRGAGVDSYNENDAENHGDSDLREGTGVDLYKKATGVIVGYNQAGEWLEYTVNVKEAGDYTMFAAVASANNTSGFQLSIDGENITDAIAVPQASSGEENYDDYNKVSANVKLPAGEHILRFTVTGDWMDIDYINFVAGKDAEDTDPLEGTTAIKTVAQFNSFGSYTYRVFDLKGKQVGTVNLDGAHVGDALRAAGFSKGMYMLRSLRGEKKFMARVAE